MTLVLQGGSSVASPTNKNWPIFERAVLSERASESRLQIMSYYASGPSKPTRGPKCGAAVNEGQRTCFCCGEHLAGEGLLARFLKWLIERFVHSGIVGVDRLTADGRPVIKRKVFYSWDEVPPEGREQMAALCFFGTQPRPFLMVPSHLCKGYSSSACWAPVA